tara:strand:+ start:12363 stop:12983 length:621 start_codon:yes stop_codon:yes gene_type:complete
MKKIVLSLVAIAFVLLSFTTAEKSTKVTLNDSDLSEITLEGNVDVEASVLYWKGTKPTGSHNGTVKLKEGSMKVKNGKIKSGEFVIDMTTIKDADGSKRLVGHLSSADFFDVKKFPTSKFVITKAKKQDGKISVTGDLTIKGVTKSITFPATVSETAGVVTFKSETFKVNRANFNVRYGSKSFFGNLKNKFINDMMEMSFEVKVKS